MRVKWRVFVALLLLFMLLGGCDLAVFGEPVGQLAVGQEAEYITLESVPDFSGEPYVILGDGTPEFSSEKIDTAAFETYAPLDDLGRCGVANACIGQELMPTEERGSIGQVKPAGWHTVKYDCVDGKYLYNRCHLIGFQLSGENANECNLITGTRYLNVEGMLPFENMVADYVKETGNHVRYRVKPVYVGDELLARGVTIEALSVEDAGEGISFFVYCYNVQPGVEIDYHTGESWEAKASSTEAEVENVSEEIADTFILNISTKKFHRPDCSGVQSMKLENRETYTGDREKLIEDGYMPCGQCKP